MAKFSGNKRPLRTQGQGFIQTTGDETFTHQGGTAKSFDAKSELFLLSVTNMVSENTYYESAQDRNARFLSLIEQVVEEDADWLSRFVPYLRNTMLMRSASTVMAAEFARLVGGSLGRKTVNAAMQRPDEPAELLAYWLDTYGRKISVAVKKGLADAVVRLYSERAALRYNSRDAGVRMADVIELVHPTPKDERQGALFKFLLDQRHHSDENASKELLPTLFCDRALLSIPEDSRREVLRSDPERLARAGWSWERLSGWLPGGMDAEAWEFAIPNMGVMALVRNLRNFDNADISEKFVDEVIARITSADEAKKARLFPYQVWSAYSNAPSDNWRRALGKLLNLTTQNIPDLDGTLVVIDTSGSMQQTMSGKSKLSRVEVAAVMAMATAKKSSDVDIVIFGQRNAPVNLPAGTSVLSGVEHIRSLIGSVGHSTFGHTAINVHFDPRRHKRVVMFTDDQQQDSGINLDHVSLIYTFDLAGYGRSSLGAGRKGRYTLGGFSDATFTAMKVLEQAGTANWPF